MSRIVSLIPSATEIVCALGFEDALVGRSHECDYPPSVQHLPILTEPKLDLNGGSREIDDRAAGRHEGGEPRYPLRNLSRFMVSRVPGCLRTHPPFPISRGSHFIARSVAAAPP